MERVCEQNVRGGADVVLVAPFTSHMADADWPSRLSTRCAGAPVSVVWVTCSDVERAKRKQQRAAPRDLREQSAPAPAAASSSPNVRPALPHRLADTTRLGLQEMGALGADLVAELRPR